MKWRPAPWWRRHHWHLDLNHMWNLEVEEKTAAEDHIRFQEPEAAVTHTHSSRTGEDRKNIRLQTFSADSSLDSGSWPGPAGVPNKVNTSLKNTTVWQVSADAIGSPFSMSCNCSAESCNSTCWSNWELQQALTGAHWGRNHTAPSRGHRWVRGILF